jgi:EAL domain-containing protein (putative c-di-GMP-specific phosphodiesterase class I)
LEITEGMLMNNADGAIQIINELKKLGIKISIDDFGTGYSSLAYLKAFNIDKLKIDRSFVTGLPDDKDDMAITSAIIQLAKSMELKIVAEGAEEIKQVDYLGLQDCDQIQGYYFAKPMARDDLINFLQNWNIRH